MASHEFEALFAKLGLPAPISPHERTPEQNFGTFVSTFLLFSLLFKIVDGIPYAAVVSMHIVAYCFCDSTNFPVNVAADILISTFVITIVIKLILDHLRLFNFRSFAKWIFILAVAHSFVVGPEKSSSYGQSHWVDLWNDAMGAFHTHLTTIFVGLVGIVASFAEEDRYDSPLFSMSAALFASTRAGVEAYVHHLVTPPH